MSDMFRRRPPTTTTTTIESSSGDRPPRDGGNRSSIKRMLSDARPSGRLPALTPTNKERKKRAAWSEKWKKLVRGTAAPERKPSAPAYEPSRYADTDDEDDS